MSDVWDGGGAAVWDARAIGCATEVGLGVSGPSAA